MRLRLATILLGTVVLAGCHDTFQSRSDLVARAGDAELPVDTLAAIVAAIVIGGLLIAFTDPVVLRAWGQFAAAPGNALAQAWDSAAGAYAAMFEGAVINPHAVASALQYQSLSAAASSGAITPVFTPLSETAVNATPLIFAGLSVALAFRAGLFNIGATGQFIGGAIVATWLGFGVTLPVVEGRLVVGKWQRVAVFNLDNRPRDRDVMAVVVGD